MYWLLGHISNNNSIVGAVAAASTNLCVSDSIPCTGSNTWIIDTGASDHMTYDAKFFDELSSNTRDPYITSANGLPSPITVPYYVSPSSPIQGERGSELKSLGLENDVFEDAALGKETTCRL
ncbi:unnamed protein product [Prunus brigantina]